MQFRADIFNIFNHPNFAIPTVGYAPLFNPSRFLGQLAVRSSTPISAAWVKRSLTPMELKLVVALRVKPNSLLSSFFNHSTSAMTAATLECCCRICK